MTSGSPKGNDCRVIFNSAPLVNICIAFGGCSADADEGALISKLVSRKFPKPTRFLCARIFLPEEQNPFHVIMAAVVPLPKVDIPDIHDSYGATFIGSLFTAMLYGLTTLQTYFYFVYYPQDVIQNKLLVSLVWILDTVQTVLVSLAMYHYLVTNYANPPALAVGHWSLFVSIGMNVTVSFCVQCFFTVRIFRLSPSKIRWWLSTFIGLIVVTHFIIGIKTVVFLLIEKQMNRIPEITLTSATPFATLSILADALIAVALCVLLHGSRMGFRRTNKLVTTLMIYAINRCLLTSIVELAAVIVFVISPKTLWFLSIEFVIGKLYANSLLASLNSRNTLRPASGIAQSIPLSGIEFHEGTSGGGVASRSIVLNISNNDSHKADLTSDMDVLTGKSESGNTESAPMSVIFLHKAVP